jgi:pimeloyl-ACP methyl ester carboxylesterase
MDESLRAQIGRSAQKIVLDFEVTFTDPGMEALRALTCPVRLISGGCSRVPTRRIAAFLAEQIPGATLQVVDDANHLLPVTHHARLGSFLLEQLAE